MRYRTIVADPPWDYGVDNQVPCSPSNRGGANPVRGDIIKRPFPYPPMSLGEISSIPVRDLGESDSRLFLWTTNRHLPDAFSVLSAWGYRYRQTLIWSKTGNPSPFGGSVAPNHAEFLLIAVRGNPPVTKRHASNVLLAPAANNHQHSSKPELFLDLIEQVSPGPYLELFARRQRLGWDTWGNEALNHIELGGAA